MITFRTILMIMTSLFFMKAFARAPSHVVLIASFDPFEGREKNNSETVANLISMQFEKTSDKKHIKIKKCHLKTVFDKAFHQLKDCVMELSTWPSMVLLMGESDCTFKFETVAKNRDHTFGPDNEGQERYQSPIDKSEKFKLGLHYPLKEMYCSISAEYRSMIHLSKDAGSFVCNNTAFQMRSQFPDLKFGLVHLPSYGCRNLLKTNQIHSILISQMIRTGVDQENSSHLPTEKWEIKSLIKQSQRRSCSNEFYRRLK